MEVEKRKFLKYILPSILFLIAIIACLCVYFYKETYHAPSFEKNAEVGSPTIEEGYNGYYPLTSEEGKKFTLCGRPATTEKSIDFYLTNEKENDVWILLEIYNEKNEFLGKSGILKQGEFLKTINLDKCLDKGNNKVNLKLRSFEPETYYSKGTINLKTEVKVD